MSEQTPLELNPDFWKIKPDPLFDESAEHRTEVARRFGLSPTFFEDTDFLKRHRSDPLEQVNNRLLTLKVKTFVHQIFNMVAEYSVAEILTPLEYEVLLVKAQTTIYDFLVDLRERGIIHQAVKPKLWNIIGFSHMKNGLFFVDTRLQGGEATMSFPWGLQTRHRSRRVLRSKFKQELRGGARLEFYLHLTPRDRVWFEIVISDSGFDRVRTVNGD